MGVSKYVFHEMAGFSEMRFGEDLDFSIRLIINGFTTQLIPNAFVYHKRRANFRQFFKQVHNSGIARIHLYRLYPKSLKLVHTLPAIFTIGILFWFLILFIFPLLGLILPAFMTIIFLDAMLQKNSLLVALSAIIATFVQLIGYGSGFIRGVWNILLLGKKEFQAFRKNFYK
jgi:GT2 family glycosyltransferase